MVSLAWQLEAARATSRSKQSSGLPERRVPQVGSDIILNQRENAVTTTSKWVVVSSDAIPPPSYEQWSPHPPPTPDPRKWRPSTRSTLFGDRAQFRRALQFALVTETRHRPALGSRRSAW